MLCMAADWVHLKMLLYAIGSGNIGHDNVKNLHSQWRAHLRSFGAPLGVLLSPPLRSVQCAPCMRPHTNRVPQWQCNNPRDRGPRGGPRGSRFALPVRQAPAARERQRMCSA